jgi:hypothetical protein
MLLFPFLLLVAVGFVIWTLMAPGRAFLPGFAELLTQPVLQQSPLSFFSGRSYVLGRFGGREVAVRLQEKRGRYQVGYLVIAVRTGGPQTLDASGIETHTRDEAGRKALFTIAANDLPLSVEGGWLKALWMPVRLCDLSRTLRGREVASCARRDGGCGELAGSPSPDLDSGKARRARNRRDV